MWEALLEGVYATTWLEYIAVTTGLLSVWFCKKANILVFPTGIVSVLIYVYICFKFSLFADAGINLFYFGMSVYGWIRWSNISEGVELPVTKNNRTQQLTGLVSVVLLYGVVFLLLYIFKKSDESYMQSYLPYVDSLTTSIFIVAMWFQAQKRVESWLYWIVGDLISIPLYFSKGLVFTSFQYLVFLFIAVAGFIEWRRLAKV